MNKSKIMIVEDEAIICQEMEYNLENMGYDVVATADNGEAAIELAEKHKPDIILMDIRIKGDMDGIEAAEIIRSRFEIPIVFMTAYLGHERIERAKITMPFGYLLKPIQERDLKVTIEMALYVAKVDVERRKTEKKLRESQFLLQKAEQVAHVGTWKLNHSTGEAQCSDELYRILGIKPVDDQNTTFLKDAVEVIHPEDRERVIKVSETAIVEKKPYQVEYRIVHPDGTERNAITKGEVVCDDSGELTEVIGVVQDITERKQKEEEQQRSDERFRTITNTAIDSIFCKDINRRYTFVNPSMAQLFGCDEMELVGKIPEEIFNKEAAAIIYEVDQRTLNGENVSEERSLTIMEKLYTFHTIQVPMRDSDGKVSGISGIVRDITKPKRVK